MKLSLGHFQIQDPPQQPYFLISSLASPMRSLPCVQLPTPCTSCHANCVLNCGWRYWGGGGTSLVEEFLSNVRHGRRCLGEQINRGMILR